MYTKGIQLFHAAVEANPVIMYPPEGVEEAREQLKLLGALTEAATPAVELGADMPSPVPQERTAVRGPEQVDIDQFLRELEDPSAQQSRPENASPPPTPQRGDHAKEQRTPRDPATVADRTGGSPRLEELATYHRTQLSALVALFYDFNHTQFVKLPVRQTVELLFRCGKEAYAHLADFENEERNRKRRVWEERLASRAQRHNTAQEMALGRHDFFEEQLRKEEEKLLTSEHSATGLVGNGFSVGDDEYDEALLAEVEMQQKHDEMLYSMFPGDDGQTQAGIEEACGTAAAEAEPDSSRVTLPSTIEYLPETTDGDGRCSETLHVGLTGPPTDARGVAATLDVTE